MTKALGVIETEGYVGSIDAADVMIKSSNVSLLKLEKVSDARVVVMVEGDVAAVKAAIDAGKIAAENVGKLIGALVIPRPEEGIQSMIQKKKTSESVLEHQVSKEKGNLELEVTTLSPSNEGEE